MYSEAINTPKLSNLERRIINGLQGGFPICERPYARVAAELETTEAALMIAIGQLLDRGLLSRFGPLYNTQAMGGDVTLAAMTVPESHIDATAVVLNQIPEVAHNYLRDHYLNMWFVVLTEQACGVGEVLADIEAQTGWQVYNMPKQREFFLELKLEV